MFKFHDTKQEQRNLLEKAGDLLKPDEDRKDSGWGLCLGGGAAAGMAHICFLEVLDTFDIRPREIAGTSIGAVIGAFYAAGMKAGEIRRIFADLSNLFEFGKLVDFKFFNKFGLLAGKNIERRLRTLLQDATFADLKTKLRVVATEFWTGEQVVFESGPIHKALRASISIPGIFVPVTDGDRILVDGASSNPLPFDLLSRDCGITLAVDVTGERTRDAKSEMPTIAEAIVSTIQIQQERLVDHILEDRQPTLYIKPDIHGVRFMEFNKFKEVEEQVRPEVEALRNWLNEKVGS